jgi:hypothetical protein
MEKRKRPSSYSDVVEDYLNELKITTSVFRMTRYLFHDLGLTRTEARACVLYWRQQKDEEYGTET